MVGTTAALPCASPDISIGGGCVVATSTDVAILKCEETEIDLFNLRVLLAARAKETVVEEYNNKMYLLD